MENKSDKNKFFLALFLIMVFSMGIFLFKGNKKIKNKEKTVSTSSTATSTPELINGFINLKNESPVNEINSPINLSLTVDSNGENVTAFDTLIAYDSASLDFVSAVSDNPDFKVYPENKDRQLTLTVVKIGTDSSQSIFKGETVVKLVFQPKAKGSFIFTVLPSSEKETTKFVNEKTEIIYPSLNEVSVSVN